MRKSFLIAGSLAFLLAACGNPSAPLPQSYDSSGFDSGSDCDADDMLEGDSDCYGYDKKKKKKKAGYGYGSKKSSYGSSKKSSYRSSSRSSSRSRR